MQIHIPPLVKSALSRPIIVPRNGGGASEEHPNDTIFYKTSELLAYNDIIGHVNRCVIFANGSRSGRGQGEEYSVYEQDVVKEVGLVVNGVNANLVLPWVH
ncbi:unnamed protein product [Ceratitis capitata]|uniref:(Mediterranean fruit fly) hypothetical protein n=1 Tax=Ceratitis capitata TaxID=7213 RepID=A0A811UHX3_CERCA|nr:unnamed protein product [Ceratitis capitata]